MREKTKVSKSILRTKSVSRCLNLREKLERIETDLKLSYEKRRSNLENKAIDKISKDSKYFFSYAKRFSKTNTEVGPFFNKDGNPVLDGTEISEMHRTQYESVVSDPLENKLINNPHKFFSVNESQTQLDNIPFVRDDVVSMIDSLSSGAADGPDGVPATLLKRCKFSLADALTMIFQ